jgi:trehalose/maltose hydrolase-like predicted phosphorylase
MRFCLTITCFKEVLPPDEDPQPFVNNSVYTNLISSLAIFFSNYTQCLIKDEPISPKTLDKARCMVIPFDSKQNIHLEYENYNGSQIKQADVVLIGFPLMHNSMSKEVRKNDLLFYENRTRPNGPAMTWGMHAIGHIEIENYKKADELLDRSFSLYVKEPFNVIF